MKPKEITFNFRRMYGPDRGIEMIGTLEGNFKGSGKRIKSMEKYIIHQLIFQITCFRTLCITGPILNCNKSILEFILKD